MPAFTIKAGETLPIFEDTLTFSSGKIAEPETIKFVMRSPTSAEALALPGVAAITNKAKGEVYFEASATVKPGNYLANWVAEIEGEPMTFPTTGYLWVEVEPSLSTKSAAQLVGLPEVKDHLQIEERDHTHDAALLRFIKGAQPLIENLTGPLIPTTYDEWHEGGHATLNLRHQPSYGYGTTPILNVLAVSEYRGPIEYNLSLVGTPTQGSVYSTMPHPELGVIVRRTSGGGTYNFWRDVNHVAQSIHLIYQAGQETVPENVNMAILETVRWWYETTQQVGRGRQTSADLETQGRPLVALPYHAEALLAPTRRPPAFA